MKRVLIGMSVFGAAVLAGWAAPAWAGSGDGGTAQVLLATPTAVSGPGTLSGADDDESPPAAGPGRCSGGMTGPLGTEIVPAATTVGPQGELLRFTVRLENRSAVTLRARYAVEIVSDTGAVVVAPDVSIPMDMRAGGSTTDARETPPGLADGFYEARVTAVATGPSVEGAEVVHMYLRVRGGHIALLDMEEFYSRSNINAEVTP